MCDPFPSRSTDVHLCLHTHTPWEEKRTGTHETGEPRQSAKKCLKLSLTTHGFSARQRKTSYFYLISHEHVTKLTYCWKHHWRTRMDVNSNFLIFYEWKVSVTKEGTYRKKGLLLTDKEDLWITFSQTLALYGLFFSSWTHSIGVYHVVLFKKKKKEI